MAEESASPAEQESVEEKPASMKKLIFVTLAASLFISAAVGAAVYFLVKADQPANITAEAEEDEAPKEPEEPEGPPIYHEIRDPFIVNLAEQPGRFLQVSVQLMTRDKKVIDAVERHMPVIRNNLLILFSTQTLEGIGSREGKEALRQAAIEEIREVLSQQSEPAFVENVLFTSLVVQ